MPGTSLTASSIQDPRNNTFIKRAFQVALNAVPQGNQLSEDSWNRRHRAILVLLWAHVLFLPWMGILNGHGIVHSFLEAGVVFVFAVGASMKKVANGTKALLATVGLVSASAILTHFFHGLTEMHFHFFVVVAVITLYQSWLPFASAIGFVLLHHGLVGAMAPDAVFNHPSAVDHPWRWAALHALFIAGESAACLAAWRLNETALESERFARLSSERANKDLADAQRLARIGSWDWNIESGTAWWSDELYSIFGVDVDEFKPTVASFLEMVHPHDRPRVAATLGKVKDDGQTMAFDCRVVRLDGTTITLTVTGLLSPDEDPSFPRMLGTCQDITERKKLEDDVQHKALHDPLTGLANRGLFRDRLLHGLSRRRPVGSLSVIFLDVDDFKSVNDHLGHQAGDELIVALARLLESTVRASDTVARFGGDEFAILVEDGDLDAATMAAERIQSALEVPLNLSTGELVVQVSMGIAQEGETKSADDLLRDSDIAMYAVKATQKGGYQVCTAPMRALVMERLDLGRALEEAVENGEFVLHYQPILDLESGEVEAFEALVRWNHPDLGVVPPIDFIPLAEKSGAIVTLGTWVLKEATATAMQLQRAVGRPLKMGVNISARQLQDADIVGIVQEALRTSGLDPADLMLEITETVLMTKRETVSRALNDLRALGVKIAIDDFGTGYSSLSYLHQFPFDILKIDQAFVEAAVEGPEEAAVAQAIATMAVALNLVAVA